MNTAINQNITSNELSAKERIERNANIKKLITWGNRAFKVTLVSTAVYQGSKISLTWGIVYGLLVLSILKKIDEYIIFPILDKIDKIDKKNQLENLLNFKSESWDKLQKMPGLDNIKQQVEQIRKHLIINLIHETAGKKPNKLCYHMQLVGNSGTGKTESAKLLASILYDLGVVKKNKVTFADRSTLVSRYINDSALKTEKIVKKALGGVLVIDEAYALISGLNNEKDGGHAVIEKLLMMMEEHKNNLVVIFLGYEDKMNELMQENKGLKSRIRFTFKTAGYNQKELIDIFKYHCSELQYTISDEALKVVEEKLIRLKELEKDCFGNARSVIEFLNKIILTQNSRLVDEVYDVNNADINNSTLFKITELDVENTSIGYIQNQEENKTNENYKTMYS